MLEVASRAYTTLMRSHISKVLSASLDPLRRQLLTVSEDNTIRIWDLDTLQQVFIDFRMQTLCFINVGSLIYDSPFGEGEL